MFNTYVLYVDQAAFLLALLVRVGGKKKQIRVRVRVRVPPSSHSPNV